MTKLTLLLITYTLIIFPAQAEKPSVSEKVRPFFNKVIGSEWTAKILGPSDDIQLPEIPKLNSKATSTDVYKKKELRKNSFDQLPANKKNAYNQKFIHELHLAVKKIAPDENYTFGLVNAMAQGASREGIYRSIILDEQYAKLEALNEPTSIEAGKFIDEYMKKYLNLSISKDVIGSTNFYILKRIVVEKTLEILDVLSKDFSKFSDWYAVFSEDMAKKHEKALEGNKLRAAKDKKVHKKWAKSVSNQLIKGEIIIKLHSVMNGLN